MLENEEKDALLHAATTQLVPLCRQHPALHALMPTHPTPKPEPTHPYPHPIAKPVVHAFLIVEWPNLKSSTGDVGLHAKLRKLSCLSVRQSRERKGLESNILKLLLRVFPPRLAATPLKPTTMQVRCAVPETA